MKITDRNVDFKLLSYLMISAITQRILGIAKEFSHQQHFSPAHASDYSYQTHKVYPCQIEEPVRERCLSLLHGAQSPSELKKQRHQ